MKKNEHNSKRGKKGKELSFPGIVSGIIAIVMVVLLFIMYGSSYAGRDDAEYKLLIYGTETLDGPLPYSSLRNSLLSCGFDYDVIEEEECFAEDGITYAIPSRYEEENVVVMSIGDNAFKVMSDINSYSRNANVEGYVLYAPVYPGNAAIEGYGSRNPSCNVAVFAFSDENATIDKMGDARLLFERMSGVDTIYGIPVSRGGKFGSDVFVSTNQMRYLSLSRLKSGKLFQLYMPTFQSELAGYLGSVYGTGVSYSRLNSWFVMVFIGVFVALIGITMFLFFKPVPRGNNFDLTRRGADSLAAIWNLGLSIWLPVMFIAMCLITPVAGYARYILYVAPMLLLLVMALLRIGFVAGNKINYTRTVMEPKFAVSYLVLVISLFVVSMLLFTNIKDKKADSASLIVSMIVFILDAVFTSVLAYADKKSRYGGEGGCSYFGNPVYFLEMLIPSVVALVYAIAFKQPHLIVPSLAGLALVIVPFVATVPLKRCSDMFEVVGIIHGIITASIIYLVY